MGQNTLLFYHFLQFIDILFFLQSANRVIKFQEDTEF